MGAIVTDFSGTIFAHPHPPRIWDVAFEYTTAQTNAVLKAGVPNQSYYIKDITVIVNAAVTVTIFEGTTVLKFKFYGSAQADGVARSYSVPKRIRPGKDITITTSGAVSVFVDIHGFTSQ